MVLGFFCLSACSSRQPSKVEGPISEKKSEESDSVLNTQKRVYFAEIQIVTETSLQSACSSENKLTNQLNEPDKLSLNPSQKLVTDEGIHVEKFAAHITLQAIGFDRSRYAFTVIDGKADTTPPFGLSVRQRPGSILELRFLDQVISMKPREAPVYTFSATELRGSCEILHQVNVFAEPAGYFALVE